jgi:uncharacterized membrane protein YsdA (DUF1294 family)
MGRMDLSPPYSHALLSALLVAAVAMLILEVAAGLPLPFAWIGGWSAAAFVGYGRDKRAARRGRMRTPEPVLHGLAVVGGFPGAWLGRSVFRHKTLHTGFLVVLVVSTVGWGALLVWWYLLRG